MIHGYFELKSSNISLPPRGLLSPVIHTTSSPTFSLLWPLFWVLRRFPDPGHVFKLFSSHARRTVHQSFIRLFVSVLHDWDMFFHFSHTFPDVVPIIWENHRFSEAFFSSILTNFYCFVHKFCFVTCPFPLIESFFWSLSCLWPFRSALWGLLTTPTLVDSLELVPCGLFFTDQLSSCVHGRGKKQRERWKQRGFGTFTTSKYKVAAV